MLDPNVIAASYAALWNEPDPIERRKGIEALWAPTGVHYTPSLAALDLDAIERRVATAYQKWVAEEGCCFVSVGNAQHHHEGVRFNWHMMRGDKIASVGFDFVLLNPNGQILSDHQFVDPNPT